MKNLHIKNLKDNNLEIIKQTAWFKQFSKEQRYYITSALENNIDITSFAKKEIQGQEMYEILTNLELKKYNTKITIPYYDWYNFYPDMKIDIDSMLTQMAKKI